MPCAACARRRQGYASGTPRQLVARGPDGQVAWRITVTRPTGTARPALAIPGGLVVLTSNGYLVALDTLEP